jgi:hypothetical protein
VTASSDLTECERLGEFASRYAIIRSTLFKRMILAAVP